MRSIDQYLCWRIVLPTRMYHCALEVCVSRTTVLAVSSFFVFCVAFLFLLFYCCVVIIISSVVLLLVDYFI